jgi:hypothetical protein
MPKTILYSLNSNAGAFTAIPSTIPSRRVEIIEDEATAPQGIQYTLPNDNFVQQYVLNPGTEPIVLGNVLAHGHGYGPVLGLPAQNSGGSSIPAATYIKMRSNTATATNVRVTEFE